jgi:hypothetical protein
LHETFAASTHSNTQLLLFLLPTAFASPVSGKISSFDYDYNVSAEKRIGASRASQSLTIPSSLLAGM